LLAKPSAIQQRVLNPTLIGDVIAQQAQSGKKNCTFKRLHLFYKAPVLANRYDSVKPSSSLT
jgi:hypothetical protein